MMEPAREVCWGLLGSLALLDEKGQMLLAPLLHSIFPVPKTEVKSRAVAAVS